MPQTLPSKLFRFSILHVLLFVAVLLRFILIPNPGFEADISFWKSWGLAPYDHGIVWASQNTNNNYPTPFAYLLWGMTTVYSFFADPHIFNEYWSNTNVLFLTVSKLPSILADFGIAAIIFWVGKNAKRFGFPVLPTAFYALLSVLYLINPISIIDGAWWGQVDAIGVFVFLLALLAALTKKPFLAGILFMAAMMTKLQNMIYGPLFFIFIWLQLGFSGLIRFAAGAALAFLGLNIEFFLSRNMAKVLESLTINYDYFPLMSLNAYNLWWIAAGADGMHVSDKLVAFGITNAKTTGLLLFASSYLFAILSLLVHAKRLTANTQFGKSEITRRFLEGLIMVVAGFFLFQTESHDRYAFPLSVFLLLLAPFILEKTRGRTIREALTNRTIRIYLASYAAFSLVYFYNLHSALVANYPQNGMPILKNITQPFATISASVLQLGFFLMFLVYLVGRTKPVVFAITAIVLVAGFTKTNASIIFKKPLPLSELTPYISEQDFGKRMTNMPANAFSGFDKWSPLSVQYAFYRQGLGTHANSYIVYDINRKFRKFSTDYGIDTQAGQKGSVIFKVYGDGRLLFESEKIGRFDLPRHADVEIAGVKKLELVVTDAGDGINDDHADWLNPNLYP
jgi:Gpi18-like mannosyltransferase